MWSWESQFTSLGLRPPISKLKMMLLPSRAVLRGKQADSGGEGSLVMFTFRPCFPTGTTTTWGMPQPCLTGTVTAAYRSPLCPYPKSKPVICMDSESDSFRCELIQVTLLRADLLHRKANGFSVVYKVLCYLHPQAPHPVTHTASQMLSPTPFS